jgi:hypothetical protein
MIPFLKNIDDKVRKEFTFWDLGFLKTYGAIPGMLIGAYFTDFVISIQWILIALFTLLLIRYIYLLWIRK